MEFTMTSKFLQMSNRITGVDANGRDYDYYRVTIWFDNDSRNFSIRNIPENSKLIGTLLATNWGEDVKFAFNLSKAKQGNSWYLNLKGLA